jgi:hypothetical protein
LLPQILAVLEELPTEPHILQIFPDLLKDGGVAVLELSGIVGTADRLHLVDEWLRGEIIAVKAGLEGPTDTLAIASPGQELQRGPTPK